MHQTALDARPVPAAPVLVLEGGEHTVLVEAGRQGAVDIIRREQRHRLFLPELATMTALTGTIEAALAPAAESASQLAMMFASASGQVLQAAPNLASPAWRSRPLARMGAVMPSGQVTAWPSRSMAKRSLGK